MQYGTLIHETSIPLGPRHEASTRTHPTHPYPWLIACFTRQFEKLGFCSMKPNAMFALGGEIHETIS